MPVRICRPLTVLEALRRRNPRLLTVRSLGSDKEIHDCQPTPGEVKVMPEMYRDAHHPAQCHPVTVTQWREQVEEGPSSRRRRQAFLSRPGCMHERWRRLLCLSCLCHPRRATSHIGEARRLEAGKARRTEPERYERAEHAASAPSALTPQSRP
jgi:hypothetical protein